MDVHFHVLNMSNCQYVSHMGLSFITNGSINLQGLILSYCSSVTEFLASSLQKFFKLQAIILDGCQMTSSVLKAIGTNSISLKELSLSKCSGVTDEGLKAISGCIKLSVLKIGLCMNISDEGLIHVGRCCQNLQELDLSVKVTDVGVMAIASGCPMLQIINLAYCTEITDSSLESISKCYKLNTLEIRGCHQVSSSGLLEVAKGCRQITKLDTKKCYNVDDSAMFSLACLAQSLRQSLLFQINLSYCSITDVGLVALASIACIQSMTILHLTGLTPNGLAAALLACRSLRKVKLNSSFKSLISQTFIGYMEFRGCMFQWQEKPSEMAV